VIIAETIRRSEEDANDHLLEIQEIGNTFVALLVARKEVLRHGVKRIAKERNVVDLHLVGIAATNEGIFFELFMAF